MVLGLLAVFSIVVRAITAGHSTGSVTPFPSASGALATGRLAPPGKVGSQFDLQDGSGDTYQVSLVKVIDPARGADQFSSPDSGKRFVGLVFKVRALTGSPKNEDANIDAVLVGGNGQNYSADYDGIAGYTNFDSGTIHVAQGDTVTGAVTFQVPDGITVSKCPVDCGQRIRFDGRVERARLAARASVTRRLRRSRHPEGLPGPRAEPGTGRRSPGSRASWREIRQGISGTPHHGRVGHGRGHVRGNAAAARPLIVVAPTTLWACRLGRRAGTWSASSARGLSG